MKKCLIIASMLCFALGGFAQEKFNREQFEQKQQAYITEKVGFSDEEAAKFFPMYREFKEKQRKNFMKIHELQRKTDIEKTTDEEFRKLNDEVLNLQAANLQLEKEYLQKFRKIISDKQFFLVGWAENGFQREMLRTTHKQQSPRGPRPNGGNQQHGKKEE